MNPLIGPCIAASLFVLFIALCHLLEKWRLATFNDRFPPISDDQFMALCPPGTNRNIALRVRRIIADQLGIEYDRIYPTARFTGDLGM